MSSNKFNPTDADEMCLDGYCGAYNPESDYAMFGEQGSMDNSVSQLMRMDMASQIDNQSAYDEELIMDEDMETVNAQVGGNEMNMEAQVGAPINNNGNTMWRQSKAWFNSFPLWAKILMVLVVIALIMAVVYAVVRRDKVRQDIELGIRTVSESSPAQYFTEGSNKLKNIFGLGKKASPATSTPVTQAF